MKDRLEQLKGMLEASPNEPFLLFAIAQEYTKRGKEREALECYERLTSVSPGYTGTYYHLGKLYERLGRKKEAADTYQKGMEITKSQNELHAYGELQSALLTLTDED